MYKNFENKNDKFAKENKLSLPAPVILGPVPRIFWQQGNNLVNKLALLLHKCWLTQDIRNKSEYDWCLERWFSACSQSGRSMIEMLGVLAIIAVLSVGGIAGYSKAMEMWKISKQKQQIAEIFMQTINLKEDFMREYNRTQTYVRTAYIMNTMEVIPDGMVLVDDYNIQDSAGNNVRIYFNSWNHKADGLEYMLMFDIFNSDKSKRQMQEYCAVFLEQAQAISPYILNVTKRNYETENGNVSGYTVDKFNFYSATPSDIYNFCKSCSSEFSCNLLLKFKL